MNEQEILESYLDNALSAAKRNNAPGGIDFIFGPWKVVVLAHLSDPRQGPGFEVVFNNFLYARSQRIIKKFFPIADPQCGENVLKLINQAKENPWTFTLS